MQQLDLQSEDKKHALTNTSSITHLCKDCLRTFKDINNYKEHRFQEHHITEFPNIRKCTMCSYATLLKSKYDCHMRCHLNNKVIKCNRCDYSTINIRHMSRHERMHMVSQSNLDLSKKKSKTSAYASKRKNLILNEKTNDCCADLEELPQSRSSNLITPPSSNLSISSSSSVPSSPTDSKFQPVSPPPFTTSQETYSYPLSNLPQFYLTQHYYQQQQEIYKKNLDYLLRLQNIQMYNTSSINKPTECNNLINCNHKLELDVLRRNCFKLLSFLIPNLQSVFNIDLQYIESTAQIDKLIDYLINTTGYIQTGFK